MWKWNLVHKFGYHNDEGKHIVYKTIRYQLPANVSYMYNYGEAPNDGYYWIDDYDNETISYIPSIPIRSGYIFGGWYKDIECNIKWDFDTGVIPMKIFDIEDEERKLYMYEETRLYAKWIKE